MEIVDRAILVVDPRIDAVVGLRDRIPPERALLRRAGPLDTAALRAHLAALRPFPFAVVGVSRDGSPPSLCEPLREVCARHPIPVLWWGEPPPGLPPHLVRVERWAELRDATLALLAGAPGGVELADHRGLRYGGSLLHSPQLEGLVAAHPRPFALGWRAVQSARGAISRHRLPLRVTRPRPGLCALEVLPA